MDEAEQNEHDGELMARVARFQETVQRWTEMDPQELEAMMGNQSTPRWMFRYEDRDTQEMLLSMVKIENLSLVIEAMLMTAPPVVRELMMQGFMRVAQRMATEVMAGLTPEEQIALSKKGREIADAMLDKAMDPNGSRPQ